MAVGCSTVKKGNTTVNKSNAIVSDGIVKLGDLVEDQKQTVNLIAVVETAGTPYQSKGQHTCRKLQIVDDSSSHLFTCLLFGKASSIQCSKSSIVRLRRVVVSRVGGVHQIRSSPGTSACVFGGNPANFLPDSRSHPKAADSLTPNEKKRIAALRQWIRSEGYKTTSFVKPAAAATFSEISVISPPRAPVVASIQTTSKENKFADGLLKLGEIQERLYFNTIVMVVGRYKEDSEKTVLRVVDGSRPPIATYKVNSQMVATSLSQVEMARLHPYFVDIVIYDEHQMHIAEATMWSYIKLKNLHCYAPNKLIPSHSEDGELVLPEICLHRGCSFGRSVRLIPASLLPADTSAQLKDLQISACQKPLLPRSVPAFSLSNTPVTRTGEERIPFTDCTTLTSDSTTVHRIMVFVDSLSPDNFPAFRRSICRGCGWVLPRGDPISLVPEPCDRCGGGPGMTSDLLFELSVRQSAGCAAQTLVCWGEEARRLLGVPGGEVKMGEMLPITKLVGKWCEFLVVRTVGKLMVVNTELIPDEREMVIAEPPPDDEDMEL